MQSTDLEQSEVAVIVEDYQAKVASDESVWAARFTWKRDSESDSKRCQPLLARLIVSNKFEHDAHRDALALRENVERRCWRCLLYSVGMTLWLEQGLHRAISTVIRD